MYMQNHTWIKARDGKPTGFHSLPAFREVHFFIAYLAKEAGAFMGIDGDEI